MILRDDDSAGGATLDGLFRRAGVRHPDAAALADPPNRAAFTDGAPRTLTYAQADQVISRLAGRLRALGLATDTVVALQLPNTVESVLTLLAVLRAGMIAAPLPLLWHRQDATAALRAAGAKAIITCARVGETAQAEIAIEVAADLFPIRQICAFGATLPDGVVPLDDLFAADGHGASAVARAANPPAHVAVVTFDVTAGGIVPVARNHAQLIAGGLGPNLEARLQQDANILSTLPVSSFAGLALTLLPWLLSGGTLTLHHSFDAETFTNQVGAQPCDAVVLPGPAVARMADAGLLDAAKCVMALWRTPERLPATACWDRDAALVDVASFGELGLVAARREADGTAAPIPRGVIGAPRGMPDALPVIETARGASGTLLLRGPMAPTLAFPPGAEHGGEPHLSPDAGGFLDTGQICRFTPDGQSLLVSSPPAGIVTVGGYRLRARDLDGLADRFGAMLAVLPQELTGQRLAGSAPERAAVLRQLQERGVNPLVSGAFRYPEPNAA